MLDVKENNSCELNLEDIIASGKPIRNVCKVLLFLEEHEGNHFTADEVALGTGLSYEQAHSALYALSSKLKIKKSRKKVTDKLKYTSNPKYKNNRPPKVAAKTSAGHASTGNVLHYLHFTKYIEQKIKALEHAISKANNNDKDFLIRIKNDYEQIRVKL